MARVKVVLLLATLFAPLLSLLPLPAQAADGKVREVVYNGEVFDGQGYGGQFYPADEATIYLLADVQNVLIPRVTDVYWWPITHEYKADWESTNLPLTGTLEIADRSFAMGAYSLRYDGGYDSAKTSLLVGEPAASAYADYQKALADYQAASNAYNDQWNEFQRELVEWGQKVDTLRSQGLSPAGLPVPKQPVPPTQPTVTVTPPDQGIVFSLPAGEYQLRLRGADGKIVSGSERKIVAFGPRRAGIAYKVIAESKWTLPDASTNPNDIILISGEKALYVQPVAEREYDSFYAAKLLSPQQRSVQDRRGIWSWLPSGPFTGSALTLSVASAAPQTIQELKYYAKQTPGAALGYEILPYDISAGNGVATFDAFRLTPQSNVMSISAPGVAGSSREIRVVHTTAGGLLLALAFAPLAGGISWLSYRRWRTR